MANSDQARVVRIHLGPRTARILGTYALLAMHGWFLVKLGLPSGAGWPELVAGMLALTGMITSILFFLGTYGVLANAPDTMLDERQLSERNRAYFSAFKYLVLMCVLGGMVPELIAKLLHFELSLAVMKNFLLLMFTTALVLPGFILAWSDR